MIAYGVYSPTYFIARKALFYCYVALSFLVLSIICPHSYVIKCTCLHYPRCVLHMRIVIVY